MKAQFPAAIKTIKLDNKGVQIVLQANFCELASCMEDLSRYAGVEEDGQVYVNISSTQEEIEFEEKNDSRT